MFRSQNQSMGTFRFEITGLLCCEFRYRHRHFQVLEGPKIAIMIVPHGINRPLSSCLFNVRAHTGLKSISREHEGALTQTEPAIIMQIPLSAKTLAFPSWWDFRCWGDTTGQMPHPLSVNKDQLRVLLHKSTRIKCVGRGGCTELWCLVGIWGPTRASTAGPLGAPPP